MIIPRISWVFPCVVAQGSSSVMTTEHQADAENLAHARGLIAEPLMPVKVEAQVCGGVNGSMWGQLLKWWYRYPTNPWGFPTKNDQFGVFGG